MGRMGTLLVSTDLHGNLADFEALESKFRDELRQNQETYWVLLGDLVHGPSPEAARRKPELYGYDDASPILPSRVMALQKEVGDHFVYVIGNHDFSHIGGPRTGKFYDDEAAELERKMKPLAVAAMRGLFRTAYLCAIAPCGALLCHGSPNDTLERFEDLDDLALPPQTDYHKRVVGTFLNSYGQPEEVTARLLARLSGGGVGLRMVLHGHDRDESGWNVHDGNQAQPVMFGAPHENKTYLRLELQRAYRSVNDLRLGHEVLRLYSSL